MSDARHPTRIEDVRHALARLAAGVRALVIARRALLLLAALGGALAAISLLDYLLRFPSWIRTFHLALGVGALAFAAWRYLLPAFRFRPSTTRLALRIENQTPALRGLLASGVEFSETGDAFAPDDPRSRAFSAGLAARVSGEAAHKWTGDVARAVLRPAPAARALVVALVVAVSWTAAAAVRADLVSIAAARTFLPWSDAAWPKRTQVLAAMDEGVHPLGAALPLRAALLKSPRSPEDTDVAARYRVLVDDRVVSSERVLLTWQERSIDLAGAQSGQLFERLIEVEGDTVEVRFETSDDATPWRPIRLVEPPAVADAEATITPPAYAAALSPADQSDDAELLDVARRARSLTMGPGRDERAVAPRSLAGSSVELTLELNKPLEPRPDEPGWLTSTLGPDAAQAGISVAADGDPRTWTLSWRLEESVRLPISLVDSFGIASMDEAVYRFEAVEDRPPAITVTEPSSDRTVLATAVVNVVGEGRDDVGLSRVWVQRQSVTPAGGEGREPSGPGGALEVVGDPVVIVETEASGDRRITAETTLDLSILGLSPGDEVWLTALAADVFATEGVARDPQQSTVRRLRVISEERFVEEVRAELSSIRQAAIRTDERQGELRGQTGREGATEPVRRGQAQVSERLDRARESVEGLIQRVQRNALADEALEGLLQDARETLDQAGRRSSQASELLDDAASRGAARPGRTDAEPRPRDEQPDDRPAEQQDQDAETPDDAPEQQGGAAGGRQGAPGQQGGSGQQERQGEPAPEDERPEDAPSGEPRDQQEPEEPIDDEAVRQAERAQEQVQEELESLIELLDRGEDAWVVRRRLDNILEEQRELQEATSSLARTTTGEAVENLSERERTELERIAQRQRELANQSRELADELSERSRALRESDPTASAGMAEAARTAQEGQVAEQQEQAAEAAGQNQLARAGQRQQEAVEQLERMREDLERAERAREEVLSRILASLIESIEGLIRVQEEQIAALQRAIAGEARFAGLDEGMIRLNQNTLGVLDQASGAGRELAPVADLVGRASEAQTRAIVALRRAPVQSEQALEGETSSLTLLEEALAEAERIEQELQQEMQDRKRRELRAKYRELLERQVALRADTQPLAEKERLTRRERIDARRLGEQQAQIRADLRAMRDETAELGDAAVFDYAHTRLDRLTDAAAESLRTGAPDDAVPPQGGAVAVLQGLVQALADSRSQEENPFGEGAGGQGQGGQQGQQEQPLIPPLAELRLLRQLQADIAQRTRAAEGRADDARVERLGEEQREIGDLGVDLIQRLQQQQQGGMPAPAPRRPNDSQEPAEPDAAQPTGAAT